MNLPHDPLCPLNSGGDHGLGPRAWLRIEQIVGGLQVTGHEDSRHTAVAAVMPGAGAAPEQEEQHWDTDARTASFAEHCAALADTHAGPRSQTR
jgi:hypothetical protein